MIQIGDDIPAAFFVGLSSNETAPIATFYVGSPDDALIIWQAVSSCFGSGLWLDDLEWNDDDAWLDY